jgi:hypothetical protein
MASGRRVSSIPVIRAYNSFLGAVLSLKCLTLKRMPDYIENLCLEFRYNRLLLYRRVLDVISPRQMRMQTSQQRYRP